MYFNATLRKADEPLNDESPLFVLKNPSWKTCYGLDFVWDGLRRLTVGYRLTLPLRPENIVERISERHGVSITYVNRSADSS